MRQEDLKYIMALSEVKNVGPMNAKKLIAYCGSAEEVFKQKKSSLEKIPGIGEFTAKSLLKGRSFERVENELEFIKKNHISALTFLDKRYPQRLKNCEDGPIVIYTKGEMNLNSSRVVSIVGTRQPTEYGKEFTEKLIQVLKEIDVVVLSGLAYGIDVTTHRACVKNNISTIGVVAHGLDRIYPSVHTSLAEKMQKNGGILTEYMSNTNPDRENFPSRNRIVAGMADATIVIETSLKGGSIITANLANDYNRDVFALPGRITDEYSVGCNRLIRSNRAALMETPEDFIAAMGWQTTPNKKKDIQAELFIELNEAEKGIIDILKLKGNAAIDILSIEAKIPMSHLSSTLLALEFKGAVRSLPGKIYTLA